MHAAEARWRPWLPEERRQAGATSAPESSSAGQLSSTVGMRLMAAHGRLQGQAGAKVGVHEGQAWQVAMAAAAGYGATQVGFS